MKTILAAILLTASVASARIGFTSQQCQQLYGSPVKVIGETALYSKNGFSIIVEFNNGSVDFIQYQKTAKNAIGICDELSENEISQLLSMNSGGKTFEKENVISMDKNWKTSDDTLSAQYANMKHMLIIVTDGYIKRSQAKKKAEENKALNGL